MNRQLDFTVDPVNYIGLEEYVDTMRDDYKMRYVIILVRCSWIMCANMY